MALKIWKYAVTGGLNVLDLPLGADLLSVQRQGKDNHFQLWAKVDDAQRSNLVRYVYGFATGETLLRPIKFLDTVQIPEDGLVYHFFEVPKPRAGHRPDA